MKNRIHNLEVPVIGLTGGIASGKSTVANFYRGQGYSVICADELIKKIYSLPETLEWFNFKHSRYLLDNKIDFAKLRENFFKSTDLQTSIEEFLYAKLEGVFKEEYQALGSPPLVIYDVPLLFEKTLESKVDKSILVYCPPKTQIERLMKRDLITKELAEEILSKQAPIDEKKEKADFVIDNSQTTEDWSKLEEEALKVLSAATKEFE